MTLRILTIALFAASAGLSACGKQGELERPAPLFGAQAKAQYEADKKAEQAVSGNPNDPDAVLARRANDENRNTTPLPPRTAPIRGQSPNPYGSAPQGALPDPYSNPNRSQ